jgi:hypothetical protein
MSKGHLRVWRVERCATRSMTSSAANHGSVCRDGEVYSPPFPSARLDGVSQRGLAQRRACAETRTRSRMVIMFAFLGTVKPAGGGTVTVAGSHRLVGRPAAKRDPSVDPLSSADARRLLSRSHPWLRDLQSRDRAIDRKKRFPRDAAVINVVPVKVVELAGEAGDVIVMHSGVLHAPARNCKSVSRLMCGELSFGDPIAGAVTSSKRKDIRREKRRAEARACGTVRVILPKSYQRP